MNVPLVGTYVTHAKLPDLGTGEITIVDGERVTIRFATGERNFVYSLVKKHLQVTSDAPAPRPSKPPRAPKAATAKAAKKKKSDVPAEK